MVEVMMSTNNSLYNVNLNFYHYKNYYK